MTITSPAPRTRLDQWQNRTRPDAGTTLGYSRFVRIMKVMLPLIASSLIVLVVVYSSGGRDAGRKIAIEGQRIDDITNDRQLVSPKLTGTDGRGQPFTVTAKGATQAPGKARRMTIDEVTADITMQDKSWVQVGAIKGELDVEGKTLDLTNSINIYSDQGYECHTEAARYDFGSGLLKGDAPIKCQGPMGLFTAKKFEGLRDPRVLRFMGGVQTTYVPTARTGEAAVAAETNPEGIAEALPDDAYVPPPGTPGALPGAAPAPAAAPIAQAPQTIIQPRPKPTP
jgi:lipopolysaccharide export system protein LptC